MDQQSAGAGPREAVPNGVGDSAPSHARGTHDQQEVHRQREFLGFNADDEENLLRIHEVIRANLDEIIEEFYERLLRFPELKPFLPDEQRLERLKTTQKSYLLSLGRDADQAGYFEERRRIGATHERMELPQKWYLGAYSKLFESIARRLTARNAEQGRELAGELCTLQKIFTLDSILAIETYYQTSVRRLEETLHRLTEAQKSLQELSRLDELTRINNRRFLLQLLEAEFERVSRFRHPFTLLFVDLDHFKRVNDEHGHSVGDHVLHATAQAMKSLLRAPDIIGRYGGEEFLIGLVEANEATGLQIAERIRKRIDTEPIQFAGHRIALTISIGATVVLDQDKTMADVIERADRAVYQAKREGRNRVCLEKSTAD